MLDIILLFILTKKIGVLAEQKGEKALKWKIYTILLWLGIEIIIITVCLAVMGVDNIIMAGLFGIAGGYLGYLIIKEMLSKKPDQENELDSLAGHLD